MKLDKPMRECMLQYIEDLKQKYDDLAIEPFSQKARIAIRQEIEGVKTMLEQDRMESTWTQLSSVFGVDPEKPDWDQEEQKVLAELIESESFKDRMSDSELVID